MSWSGPITSTKKVLACSMTPLAIWYAAAAAFRRSRLEYGRTMLLYLCNSGDGVVRLVHAVGLLVVYTCYLFGSSSLPSAAAG